MMPTNGYDRAELERYLQSIDSADDELDTLKGEYMASCRGPRSRIREVVAAAREAGMNAVAFRELMKQHRADRAQERRLDALEPDDAQAFQLMQEALGDYGSTPLGAAALERAKPQGGDEALATL